VFFNGGRIASEFPQMLSLAAADLAQKARKRLGIDADWRVIGAAKGAITPSYAIAAAGGYRHAWADRNGETFVFDRRFAEFFEAGEGFIRAEDTITTGGTLDRLWQAALAVSPQARRAPFVLTICNRSGKQSLETGESIISLVELEARVWKEGENPFTHDGKELTPPMRPKTHWGELTRKL
jgi:orotate phosphoribosyltransferase